MKQKIFQIFCVAIAFFLFGYFYGEEYSEFRQERQEQYESYSQVQEKLENYWFENIGDIGVEKLWYTPYKDLQHILSDRIKEAKERVYVSAYIFTNKSLRSALISAHEQGKDVKVILENNPYKAPYLNDETYDILQKAGVAVVWSDPLNYSLNHAKYILLDDTAYISTGNFSYSLFTKNRDFIVELYSDDIVKKIEEIFTSDFQHKKKSFFHESILISPDTSRKQIYSLIEKAENSLDMYFPYIADEALEKRLFELSRLGVRIRIIVEKSFFTDENNKELLDRFHFHNIEISPINKYKLHAKAILSDDTYLYIGSINFSRHSFDENRELGVMIQDTEIISQFQKIFNSDL